MQYLSYLLAGVRKRLEVPKWESTVSNWITLSRMQLGAFAVLVAIMFGYWKLGFGLFVWFVFTDFIDGSLARVMGSKSAWGAYGDPAADKLFLDPILFVGWFYKGCPILYLVPLAIIYGYDVSVMLARSTDGGMTTSVVAKLKQVCLFAAVGIPIATEAHVMEASRWADDMLWAATALTVISGAFYVRQKLTKKHAKPRLVAQRRAA